MGNCGSKNDAATPTANNKPSAPPAPTTAPAPIADPTKPVQTEQADEMGKADDEAAEAEEARKAKQLADAEAQEKAKIAEKEKLEAEAAAEALKAAAEEEENRARIIAEEAEKARVAAAAEEEGKRARIAAEEAERARVAAEEAALSFGPSDLLARQKEWIDDELKAKSSSNIAAPPLKTAVVATGTAIAPATSPAPLLLAGPADPAVITGYILKEGHRYRTWKKRFFVLDAGMLSYYQTQDDVVAMGKKQKGEYYLQGASIKEENNMVTITVAPKEKEDKADTLKLDLSDESERRRWMEGLNAHMRYLAMWYVINQRIIKSGGGSATINKPPTGTTINTPGTPKSSSNNDNASCSAVASPATASPGSPQESGAPIRKMGWINKQGAMVKSWNNRYFVLDKGTFIYYKDSSTQPPYGVIAKGEHYLAGYTVSEAGDMVTLTPGGSPVKAAAGSSKSGKAKAQVLVMEIKDAKERAEWIVSLRDHIAYLSNESK